MKPGSDPPNSAEAEPEPAGEKTPKRWESVEITTLRNPGGLTSCLPGP